MLYKVDLTFESVDQILKCDHSNESYWAVLSCGAVHYVVQGGNNFLSLNNLLNESSLSGSGTRYATD